MKTFLIILHFILNASISCCGQRYLAEGARITAIGGNCPAVQDYWNLNGNPAAMKCLQTPVIGISHTQFLSGSDFTSQDMLLIAPVKRYSIGLSIIRYGISAYNEITAGLNLMRRIGESLNLALKTNYHQLKITNYGSSTAFSLDIGTYYQVSSQINVGLAFRNLSFERWGSIETQNRLIGGLSFGFSYQATDKVLITLASLKELVQPININFGIEYEIIHTLYLRTGWNSNPLKYFGGFGLQYQKLNVDVAVQDSNLGITPKISIVYAF